MGTGSNYSLLLMCPSASEQQLWVRDLEQVSEESEALSMAPAHCAVQNIHTSVAATKSRLSMRFSNKDILAQQTY